MSTLTPTKTISPSKYSIIQTRISKDLKKQAEIALSKTGLSLNDLVRISINKFVEEGQLTIKSSNEPRLSDDVRAKVIESLEDHKKGDFITLKPGEDIAQFVAKNF